MEMEFHFLSTIIDFYVKGLCKSFGIFPFIYLAFIQILLHTQKYHNISYHACIIIS